jgi:hypothetical protein
MLWIDTESGTYGQAENLRLVEDSDSYYFDDMSDSEISEFGLENGKPAVPARTHGDNIVRLHPDTVTILMERLSYADLAGKSVRIVTGTNNKGETFLKFDIGNSGWTPPIYGVEW